MISFDWENDGIINHSTVVVDTDESNPQDWNTVVAIHSIENEVRVSDLWKKHGLDRTTTVVYIWHVTYP